MLKVSDFLILRKFPQYMVVANIYSTYFYERACERHEFIVFSSMKGYNLLLFLVSNNQ